MTHPTPATWLVVLMIVCCNLSLAQVCQHNPGAPHNCNSSDSCLRHIVGSACNVPSDTTCVATGGPAETPCCTCQDTDADEVDGDLSRTTDTTSDFLADGDLTTKDTDGEAGIDGPYYYVPEDPLLAPNWTFEVKHRVAQWDPEAKSVRLFIRGVHITGPHHEPDEVQDIDPNVLKEKRSAPKDIPFEDGDAETDDGRRLVASGNVNHQTTSQLGLPHIDWYRATSEVFAVAAADGEPNHVTGAVVVRADHTKKNKRHRPRDLAMGASSGNGTVVSFDSLTGALSLVIAPIDILDSIGGQSMSIEPIYAGDPILGAQIGLTALQYLGPDASGRFRFGEGTLTWVDSLDRFAIEGHLEEYLIDTTLPNGFPSTFALFDELSLTDISDPAAGASRFLQDFVDVNLFFHGVPLPEQPLIQGVAFNFTTDIDLVAATNGFTVSATLPATVLIAGSEGVDDVDLDGVVDQDDNCVAVFNPDQLDADGDAAGAACDCNDGDGTIFPEADEINDGLDNQCPGDPGYGVVDEISGVAGFFNPNDKNEYSWPVQTGASRYDVARAEATQYNVGCVLFPKLPDVFLVDSDQPVPGGILFYLVRPALPNTGDWGQTSWGSHRVVPCQ